ncbi:MAG: hypothetical protein KGH72_03715 [Candidatus Micrarchaeota archaeon]|nr:hypothetical protein [Candidatus Micrarchaeota archaeon]
MPRSTVRERSSPEAAQSSVDGINGDGLAALKANLRRVKGADLTGTLALGPDEIPAGNFRELVRYAQGVDDPDMARNCLYYCFQPLLDVMLAGGVHISARASALRAMEGVLGTSRAFLTSYYLGDPDMEAFIDGMARIEPDIRAIGKRVAYRTKQRNIDHNGIYPVNIQSFLISFTERIVNGDIGVPDFVVGCASGASEVAFALAGILGVDARFIRKSKRRGDKRPLILKAHAPVIKEAARGSSVVCVEDYVCTGRSIGSVMAAVSGFGPSYLVGASVKFYPERKLYARNVLRSSNLNLFEGKLT